MPTNKEAMEAVGDYKSGWHDPENSTIRFDFGLSEEVVNALVESAYITRFSGDWSLEADTECSIFYCSSKEGKNES